MSRISKTEIIKQHFLTYGTITDNQAHDLYGVNRLSQHVFTLRRLKNKPMNILTIWHDGIDRFGNKCRYGEYKFLGFIEENKDGEDR